MAAMAASADSYTWGNVRFEGGGFVDGIIPSRTQPGLVYARTDVGGAYRWDSTGGKWIPLMDWISEADKGLFGTEALALDPNDSKRLYILCGTYYFSNAKTMILRSSDYGATFDTVNVTSKFKAHGNGMGRQTGEKLAVDPQNSAILLCGTRMAGLWKSADTGKTWNKISTVAAASDTNVASLLNDVGISFVLFDTSGGKTADGATKNIYLGTAQSGTTGLYRSTDGGATFDSVSGAPSLMAMRAALSSDGNLYITFSNGPGPYSKNGGKVMKYATATGSWTNITPKTDSGFYYASGHEGYGYGFGGISIDPKNPQRLLLSTESCYGGANLWADGSNNAGDVIFLSENGGTSWKVLNSWSATQTVDANGNGWVSGSSIHWAGTLEFDPFDNTKAWVGSGNGVFRTDDLTATSPLWKFQSRGIEETVPMDIVSVPGGPLVTAIMDYDGATYPDGDITASVAAHTHPIGTSNSLGYAALTGDFLRSGRVTDYSKSPSVTYDVLYHSTDSGATWTATDTATLPGSAGSLAISADGRVFLLRPSYLHNGVNASANTFYRSTDGGATWKAASGLSAQNGRMVADQVNPANFYIIPDGYSGDVYRSTDTGATFAKAGTLIGSSSNGEYSASSGMLRANPEAANDLWVCLDAEQSWQSTGYSSYGLAHSTDGGATWTRIHTMTACLTMGFGKAADDADFPAIYMWGKVGTDGLGIYRSTDKAETWTRINDATHQYGGPANGNFVTGDMNVFGRVYMSTAGRGVVYGQPAGTASGISSGAVLAAGRLFVTTSQMLVKAPGRTALRLELRDARGRLVLTRDTHDGDRIQLQSLGRGVLFARLTDGGKLLARRPVVLP